MKKILSLGILVAALAVITGCDNKPTTGGSSGAKTTPAAGGTAGTAGTAGTH